MQPVTQGAFASVYKKYDTKGNLIEWYETTAWIIIKK